jgi:hypothetical protein
MRTAATMMMLATAAALLAVSSPAAAQQKTAKDCLIEWGANKAENQAKGITAKAFVEQCRSASAAASTATNPVAAQAAKPVNAPAKPASTIGLAGAVANQFANETLAKARCPRDTVVWANLESKIYHFNGNRDFGNTKEGAYMCEKDALGEGIHAAKNEKHP